MKKASFLLLIFLLSGIAFAQEGNGWPLETVCIDELSPTPADWAFSGTILIRGYAGIHAYHQDWETPRILISEDQMPDALTEFGSFSPDYQWFAYFTGDYTITETYSSFAHIHGMWLVNLDAPDEAEFFPHRGRISGFYYRRPVPIWLDNEHVYLAAYDDEGSEILNISTDEIELVELDYESRQERNRASYYPESLNASSPDRSQFAPDHENFLFWLPDGSGYLRSWHEDDLSPFYFLSMKQGEAERIIWSLPENQRIQQWIGGFSSNGRYAAFLVEQLYLIDNQYTTDLEDFGEPLLHLLDLQEQRVINTCLTVHDYEFYSYQMYDVPRSIRWSSNSLQLAFLSEQFYTAEDNLIPIRVLDVDNYQLYTVAYQLDLAYQDSFVIGWRPD